MATVIVAGTSENDLRFERYVSLELELLDYFVAVEEAVDEDRFFRKIDPYGNVQFSADKAEDVRRHVARLAAAIRNRETSLPAAPEVVGLEADERPCGEAGALECLHELELVLDDAAELKLNVHCLGD